MAQAHVADFRMIDLGDRTIYALSDGAIEAPLRPGLVRNASIDDVRSALRADGHSGYIVRTPFTALAIVRNGDVTLVDSGTGGFPVYGPDCGHLLASLAAAGLDPTSVTTILLTHLHGDHIYGLFDVDTLEPRFPDAEIIVPGEELTWWTGPSAAGLDLGPTRVGLAARIRATLAVWKNVRAFQGEREILPGVYPVPAYGHSPGHTAYLVTSRVRELLVTADVCINRSLYMAHPEWQAALDQDPLMAAATRRRIFDRAVVEGLLVTGTHWELPNIGTITRAGGGYRFVEIDSMPDVSLSASP